METTNTAPIPGAPTLDFAALIALIEGVDKPARDVLLLALRRMVKYRCYDCLVYVTVDELCEAMGYAPRHKGGFRAGHRAAAAKAVRQLLAFRHRVSADPTEYAPAGTTAFSAEDAFPVTTDWATWTEQQPGGEQRHVAWSLQVAPWLLAPIYVPEHEPRVNAALRLIQHRTLEQWNGERPLPAVPVTADELCDAFGFPQHPNGGYAWKHLEEAGAAMAELEELSVPAVGRGGGVTPVVLLRERDYMRRLGPGGPKCYTGWLVELA